MRRMASMLLLFVLGSGLAAEERLLALHGPMSEIVVLLGRGNELVGADSTATWPPYLRELPSVGYVRQLSAEGVVSLRADLILHDEDAGPPTVMDQLRALDQPLRLIPEPTSLAEIPARVRAVGAAIGREDAAERLARAVANDLEASRGDHGAGAKALFIFHPQGDTLTASGSGTAADELLGHVGLVNVLADEEGWVPLQAEAAVAAGPTVIVTTGSALRGVGGHDELLAHPGLAATPAARKGRVIVLVTMAALGYGPRTGREALRFAAALDPDAELPAPAIDDLIDELELADPKP